MQPTLFVRCRLLAALVVGIALWSGAFAEDSTWRLVKRQLPNGTILTPPEVYGMSTNKNGINQLIVFWPTEDGKSASLSELSRWEWAEDRVTATPLLMIYDDGSGKPPVYVKGGDAKTSAITKEGTRMKYQHPLDPPFIDGEGDNFTATLDGAFIDYWQRVQ